ncbi:hypothetical protein [Streptomyces sp. NPDC096033]
MSPDLRVIVYPPDDQGGRPVHVDGVALFTRLLSRGQSHQAHVLDL